MTENRYQVVGECAYVRTSDASGVSWRLLEKGALVFGDSTPNLQHLLDNGYVVKVGDEATGGVDAAGVPSGAYTADVPPGITTTPVEKTEEQRKADAEAAEQAKADAELAEKRAAAKAKLPADGSVPDGRAAQPVWVEYLAAKGGRYEDLAKADKDELIKLARQQS
ncbi:hypothetical protein ACWKSP_26505 [Micromonosporaceae bacterium Da 78-11]